MATVKQFNEAKGIIPKKKKRTPEEIAQAKAEGQAYIQEREKLASKQNISSEEAAQQLAPGERKKELKEQIKKTPEQFGLEAPGQEPIEPQPESMETIETPAEVARDPSIIRDLLIGETLKTQAEERGSGLTIGIAPIGIGAAGGGAFWKAGGRIFSSLKNAVWAGNTVKTAATTTPLLSRMAGFAIGGYAALKTGEGIISYFSGRKIDEQQQALNTLGQMATTIGGQAQEGAGDWRKGLNELKYMKQEILRLESAIKAGTIQSAAIKYNGKIYDINADIADQISTIDEQVTILQSFALSGAFPELDPYAMQDYLRELEMEGYIQPVDLTTARRPTE